MKKFRQMLCCTENQGKEKGKKNLNPTLHDVRLSKEKTNNT